MGRIRLSASRTRYSVVFTLERDGTSLITTGNRVDLGDRMIKLGIEHPWQLIEAAEKWGVVYTYEK